MVVWTILGLIAALVIGSIAWTRYSERRRARRAALFVQQREIRGAWINLQAMVDSYVRIWADERGEPYVPIALHLVPSPEFSAFAITASGQRLVVVYTGTLTTLPYETLRFVVAHEVAHHQLGHAVTQQLTALIAGGVLEAIRPRGFWEEIGLTDYTPEPGWLLLLEAAATAGIQYQSRQHELAADAAGLALMAASGFPLEPALEFFALAARLEGTGTAFDLIQQTLFGSHPLARDRFSRAQEVIRRIQAPAVTPV